MFHQRIKYPDQIIREAEQAQQAAGNGTRKANGNGRPGEPGNAGKSPQQPRSEKQT